MRQLLADAPDAHVLMCSRDAARGAAAREALLAEHPGAAARVEALQLDVNSDASTAAAAAALSAAGVRLAGLVNNAGIVEGPPGAVIDTNLHGVKRVCDALLPLLTPGARIVNISSGAAPMFVAKCSDSRQARAPHRP